MKICALLVPKEMKVEHTGGVKTLSDEQLDQAILALRRAYSALPAISWPPSAADRRGLFAKGATR
jgi:hypothetical protein